MKHYEPKTFTIPELRGISAKNIEEHLKLYQGYVTQTNTILEKINGLPDDPELMTPLLNDLHKRFGFEYNGMRNHEVYFASLEGGASALTESSELSKTIISEWGSFERWIALFKTIATTRGVGWAMFYYDRREKRLLNAWVDEQHLGQLQDCTLLLALDMWEHAFVADYQPSGKKQYIEDYLANVNWNTLETKFASLVQ